MTGDGDGYRKRATGIVISIYRVNPIYIYTYIYIRTKRVARHRNHLARWFVVRNEDKERDILIDRERQV